MRPPWIECDRRGLSSKSSWITFFGDRRCVLGQFTRKVRPPKAPRPSPGCPVRRPLPRGAPGMPRGCPGGSPGVPRGIPRASPRHLFMILIDFIRISIENKLTKCLKPVAVGATGLLNNEPEAQFRGFDICRQQKNTNSQKHISIIKMTRNLGQFFPCP